MSQVYITKATGEKEEFDSQKLKHSLLRSGAKEETVGGIVSQIERGLKNNDSTKDIYHHAFKLLREREKPAAIRYSLRKAILDLGPTGFPFEQFVSEIFRSRGFETATDYVAKG